VPPSPGHRQCTAYLWPGLGGTPLALPLTDWLGRAAAEAKRNCECLRRCLGAERGKAPRRAPDSERSAPLTPAVACATGSSHDRTRLALTRTRLPIRGFAFRTGGQCEA